MGRVDPSAQIDYSAGYYYAYPTSTSTIAPDPTGTYGQPTPLLSSSVFDLNTGLAISITDANGRTTSFEYNDPLYRQTKVIRPDGGWTSTFYNDTPADTYVRTQTLQRTTPMQVIESYQYFDKAGRSVRTFANEGTTYLTTDTEYDRLGRVWRVSNPYRTTAPSLNIGVNPSHQWTTNTYDSQNRVLAVTTADGAHTNSSYGYSLISGHLGTTVTASDQMGRARKGVTDGFGRVIQVIEAPNGLAHQTNYTYDVFNNLRKVEQGSQLRYFGYDSLARVIFVRQIEQTINGSLPAWTDSVTNYSGGWTAAFTYDNNNNIVTRRDARNIMTTFTYDQLNRVTTVRYTNDPQNTPGVDNYYDGYRSNSFTNIPNVKGRGWQNETNNQIRFTVDNFDVMGRPTMRRQQFWLNNEWKSSYQVSVSYDLSGALIGQIYPSGHTVAYESDQLGRLQQFSGSLGDGGFRIYASNFQYNDIGALQQEQFGTQTPLYHKQRFNARGQLWDVRLSTVSFGSDPTNGDRGSIVNYYSSNYSQGGSGTDNNGNLLRQEIYVPNGPYFQQTYSYDDLNRLTSVNEKLNGTGADSFKQFYAYDRWGNRSIDWNLSSSNVARPTYTIDSNTNRLIAPTGYEYGYDNAGNQTNDSYTGGGQRAFDAENHMISAQESSGWEYYKYSGSGLRVRRIVNGVEIWQVYGLGGELLAEYAVNAGPENPKREYGYRNGQLLITADGRTNVALAANGGVASASSAHTCCGFSVGGAINDNIRGPWGNGEGWNDATPNELPDWFQVDFAGNKTINEIDVFSLHDNYTEQNTPTEAQLFSLYGLVNFEVQCWSGSAWVTIPGGSVSGNNKVWRKFTFAPITTSKIRLWITSVPDSWSRLVELQAWQADGGGGAPNTSGLVGQWKFDENSNTTAADSSGNGNTGTLSSGATWATGQSGSATSLDGVDDYVQVGSQSSLVVSSAATFSAWIYPTGPGSHEYIGGIIVNKEGEYEITRFPDGTIQWAFANTNPGWNWTNTGYVAPLNQWTHVSITYDNGGVKTYINGTLTHSYSGAGAIGDITPAQNDFRIGGRQGLSNNFQGRIDEVRVYNRALSASEVATLPGATPAGLAGYWKFDESSGTTAADASGNNNTGTLSAGASWATGQSGAATTLDGVDDYVQVGSQSSLVVSSAATFSAWIYPTGPGSHEYIGGIIVNKEGEYEITRFPDGTIQWAFANTNPGWNWINTGYVAPLNQWTHVSITYDNGVVKTYINGTLTHTYSGSGTIGDITPTQNDFRIGGRQGLSNNFQGRIDEVRVYNRALSASEVATLPNSSVSSGGARINWLVTDHLGTPRIVVDESGSLASVKRHDYLPFGEEIGGSHVGLIGGRLGTTGYTADDVRQKFTGYEADAETGLYYAQARYQSGVQGRFTGVDPLGVSANTADPQTFNRYSYVVNNPLRFVDPTGALLEDMGIMQTSDEAFARTLQGVSDSQFQHNINNAFAQERNLTITQTPSGDTSGGNYITQNTASQDATGSQDAAYPTLTQSNAEGTCSIAVTVVGAETTTHQTSAGTYTSKGFAFTVEVNVFSDKIGRVGDPNADPEVIKAVNGDQHNGGRWIVGQWIYPRTETVYERPDGSRFSPQNPLRPNNKTSDDSPMPESRTVSARRARWSDSPGFTISAPFAKLVSGRMSANFLVYAQNGNQRCAVRFHIDSVFIRSSFMTRITRPR